jgi:two-component system nitrate/nitrite response regulator NarL
MRDQIVTKMASIRSDQIKVLLADDHRMITDMIQLFLTETADMVIRVAESLEDAAHILQAEGGFDVVLLDMNMPGMNGIAGLKRMIRLNEGKPVSILTGATTPRMMQEIMAAGAAGIVLKKSPLRSLANAIRFMNSGERYLPLELIQTQATPASANRPGNLSDKEMDVLLQLSEGKSNKEIANDLAMAEATVKMHVTGICRKLGANNRTRAVIMAKELGLV